MPFWKPFWWDSSPLDDQVNIIGLYSFSLSLSLSLSLSIPILFGQLENAIPSHSSLMSHFLMGKFTTFFLHKAFNQQIDQHGHRINVRRENWEWYIDYIWRELISSIFIWYLFPYFSKFFFWHLQIVSCYVLFDAPSIARCAYMSL